MQLVPTFYFCSTASVVGAAHNTVDPEIAAAEWRLTCGTLLSPILVMPLPLPCPYSCCSMPLKPIVGLVTALDLLAALSLPHAVAQYGAIDSPAVVDCIGYFTWQFTLLQEVIAFEPCREQFTLLREDIFYFDHAGRPRRPPYRCTEP